MKVQGRNTSSSSKNKQVKFVENGEDNKSLDIEGEPDEIKSSRKSKQEELKLALEYQIQEKSRQQERERGLKRQQDELEEERIRKEVEQEEERYRMERETEQRKVTDAQRQNEDMINARNNPREPPPQQNRSSRRDSNLPGPQVPDYSKYDNANKDYSQNSFAPGQAPPEFQPPGPANQQRQYENDVFKNGDPAQKYHRLPNYPMRNFDVIHKEKLISELQLMLKQNLEVESEKLKEEFQFNQKEFTDQIDKLRSETEKAIMQRNAARKELGRLKGELDYKRDYDENYSNQLMVALTRYNPANMYRPPKEDPTSIGMVAPFRGAGIQRTRMETPTKRNSYEKMFFQDVEKDARQINSHRGEKKSTAELFNVPSKYLPFKKDQKMNVESELIPLKDEMRSRKIDLSTKRLKQTYSMDQSHFRKPIQEKKDDDRLDTEAPPNFVYHLEDSRPGDLLPDIKKLEQGKSIAMPNGGLGVADDHLVKEDRNGITANYGGQLPSLPEYDGLQNGDSTISKLMKNFIGRNTGENEFKSINRRNDLILQKLVDDKPEERYRTKPHVYVDPKEDTKFGDTFMQSNGTFNDRSDVGFQLPTQSNNLNYDVINEYGSTLNRLKSGEGRTNGIRDLEMPLKPRPFNALH